MRWFTRLNVKYCVHLILTCLLCFVNGGINHCGKNIGDIGKFTQVRVTNDGFCSENGPSCCESWSGLVNPGLELLFGKGTTYSKLSRLNDKIRNIRSKIGDLECHKNNNNNDSPSSTSSSSSQLFNDIVTSLDVMTDMNWIALLNNTFHGSNCGRRLTELVFCSPDYCLYNQTEQVGSSHSCDGQCQNIIEACVSEPFEYLSSNWKHAIGSLSTTLRILSAKTSCQADKGVIETLEWQLKEFRDPVSWIMESCATYGFNPCVSKTNNFLINKSQDMDKSIESHSSKLQSLISSLEKHWQGHEIMSILDQDDLASSSSSGSGWNINDQFTDDEDLLNEHMYGSGSGQPIDHHEETGAGGGGTDIDTSTFGDGSSTSSPPDKGRTGSGSGSGTSQPPKGSSSSRICFNSYILYSFSLLFINLVSVLSFVNL